MNYKGRTSNSFTEKIVIKKKKQGQGGEINAVTKAMLPTRHCERSSLLYCSFILSLNRKYRSVHVKLFIGGIGQGIRSQGYVRI